MIIKFKFLKKFAIKSKGGFLRHSVFSFHLEKTLSLCHDERRNESALIVERQETIVHRTNDVVASVRNIANGQK